MKIPPGGMRHVAGECGGLELQSAMRLHQGPGIRDAPESFSLRRATWNFIQIRSNSLKFNDECQ